MKRVSTLLAGVVAVAAQGPAGTCGKEDCGAACPDPPFPTIDQLPTIHNFPNPFVYANGSAVTSKAEWICRRAELNRWLQKYELGTKPTKPAVVSGTVSTSTVSVTAGDGTKSITFNCQVTLPTTGSAPYPAIIGVGGVSLNTQLIRSMGIATINLPVDQIAQQNSEASRGIGSFYDLYGKDHTAGAMAAWAWAASRLLDVLETDNNKNFDMSRLGVTGCSRNGKGALVVGALDERFALTIPQESGSGGAASWRISDLQNVIAGNNNTVQSLHEITSENVWFTQSFSQFNWAAQKLPFDHHALHGLVAPRGMLEFENLDYVWLGNLSTWANALVSRDVYKAHGVIDNFGFSQEGGHSHCAFPANQNGNLTVFFNKFLLGQDANTAVFTTSAGAYYDAVWKRSDWQDWTPPTLT